MTLNNKLTREEQEEVQRLCDEEACVVTCDFVGTGELLMSEEFLEHTPLPHQLQLLKDWIQTLTDIKDDLEGGNKENFTWPDDTGPRSIN
jgi:hypothetical protein